MQLHTSQARSKRCLRFIGVRKAESRISFQRMFDLTLKGLSDTNCFQLISSRPEMTRFHNPGVNLRISRIDAPEYVSAQFLAFQNLTENHLSRIEHCAGPKSGSPDGRYPGIQELEHPGQAQKRPALSGCLCGCLWEIPFHCCQYEKLTV